MRHASWIYSAALCGLAAAGAAADINVVAIQEGFNGYTGFKDTWVNQSDPDANYNEAIQVWVDENWDAGTNVYGFFEFPNIVGDGPNQVPEGANVISARLEWYILQPGGAEEYAWFAHLANPIDFETATYNSLWGGSDPAEGEDYLAENKVPMGLGHSERIRASWEIAPLVQDWVNGEPNNGVMIVPHPNHGDAIALLQSEISPAPKLTVESAAGGVYTFQWGQNGYFDSQDAMIRNNFAGNDRDQDPLDLNYGDIPTILCDGNDGLADYWAMLLRFDNIYGEGEGQIPPGTEIAAATLRILIPNAGNLINLREILVDWSGDTVTGASFIEDDFLPVEGVEMGPIVTTFEGGGTGNERDLDVTSSLQAWSADPAQNRGWIFDITGSDGVVIYANESAINAEPPTLFVIYETEGSGIPAFGGF